MLGLILLGALFWVCLVPCEYLWIPESIGYPARMVYRTVYFIVLPFRAVLLPVLGEVDHRWTLLHTTVVAFGAPFFYAGLGRALKRLRRRRGTDEGAAAPQTPSRRVFLLKSAAAVGGSALGYGALVEPERLQVRTYRIGIRGLPAGLDGLRIVHIADTHYGPFTPLAYIHRIVAQANALAPDLVALTGDYVHRSERAIEPGIGAFAQLDARFGAAAVLGNHEHWEGARACRRALLDAGVRVLDNARARLTPEGFAGGTPVSGDVCVAGVGDLWEGDVDFARALHGVPEEVPRLVLSHNPDACMLAPEGLRIDLMLAGHTHGGQVRLPFIGSPFHRSPYGQRYLGGLCQGPAGPVVVSRGASLAGIPIRLGVPPEIGLIVLERA